MSRVVAVTACGLFLAACSASWMPSMELPSLGGGGASSPASLAVESDPPGAQASTPDGGSCVTPCRLNVAATGPFSVNIALNGYVPQSVPVRIVQPDDPHLGSDESGAGPRLDPNPVYVELERAPPPAPPAKKKPAKHPAATSQAPAATQPLSGPTTASAPPALTAPPAASAAPARTSDAPWPMPR